MRLFAAAIVFTLSTGTGINYTFEWRSRWFANYRGNQRVLLCKSGGQLYRIGWRQQLHGRFAAGGGSQNPSPSANAGPGQNFTACALTTITLGGSGPNPTASGGTGPYNILWSPTVGLNDSAAANPTVSGLGITTTYQVLVTDAHGCTATSSTTVTVTCGTLSVAISAIGDRTWCFGTASSITLTAHPSGGDGGLYSFLWIPSTYLSVDND